MIQTLKELKKQVNKLAELKIEEAAAQIDTYLKVVEAEQKRRSK